MFSKSALVHSRNPKLFLHDFPGGAEGFELIVRFCYNRGRITCITPSNALLLHSAAEFLEIDEDETNRLFENIPFLSWPELLGCLKQSQELQPFVISSHLVQEILNAVVDMISKANVASSRVFSSSDSCTTCFSDDSFHATVNWLHDLEFLSIDLFEKVLSTMVARDLDHGTICSFLIHYQRVKFSGLLTSEKKCRIIKVVVATIDGGLRYSFRRLWDVLQKCASLKIEKSWTKKVEKMVGRRLDEATLDDLLVPCPKKNTCAYDVDLVLRLLKIFLIKLLPVRRSKKVGVLMDLYLSEVAPDPHLGFCKFLALARAVPASARRSCDKVCEAMGMFFKVHGFLSEEEKMRMCSSVLNYEKLSSELLMKLAENNDFPDCVAADAQLILQSKIKSTLSANVVNVFCPRRGRSLPILCS